VIGERERPIRKSATIIVMSDHGFANFGRQFNVNTWLRENEYLGPKELHLDMKERRLVADSAYGIGINGLYLNLKGREKNGVVDPGQRDRY